MMEIRLNLYQADRDFQVEIGGGGFGYRLFGPKFDGSSRLIKSVILSERDKEEIVRFVKPDAEAVERERDSADERARMLNFQKEKLEAALAAAQGEVDLAKKQITYLKSALIRWRKREWPGTDQAAVIERDLQVIAQEALGGKAHQIGKEANHA
jgi:hypothetical protein